MMVCAAIANIDLTGQWQIDAIHCGHLIFDVTDKAICPAARWRIAALQGFLLARQRAAPLYANWQGYLRLDRRQNV
jgi:hypothetical protein